MHYTPVRDPSGKFSSKDKKIHTMRLTEEERQHILELRDKYDREKCYFCKQERNLVGVHLECLQEVTNYRKRRPTRY